MDFPVACISFISNIYRRVDYIKLAARCKKLALESQGKWSLMRKSKQKIYLICRSVLFSNSLKLAYVYVTFTDAHK